MFIFIEPYPADEMSPKPENEDEESIQRQMMQPSAHSSNEGLDNYSVTRDLVSSSFSLLFEKKWGEM